MTEEWLEHVELPEGQFADLLKRYPYERATMIELALERDRLATGSTVTNTGFVDAVLRASLWRARFTHSLTGEDIGPDDVGMADDGIIKDLRLRAMTNYVAWYDVAHPGPKGSSRTASRTRTSGKATAPAETSAPG